MSKLKLIMLNLFEAIIEKKTIKYIRLHSHVTTACIPYPFIFQDKIWLVI